MICVGCFLESIFCVLRSSAGDFYTSSLIASEVKIEVNKNMFFQEKINVLTFVELKTNPYITNGCQFGTIGQVNSYQILKNPQIYFSF